MRDEHKDSPARMRYSINSNFCILRAELQTDAAPMLLWFVACQNSTTFKLASLGMRGSHGPE